MQVDNENNVIKKSFKIRGYLDIKEDSIEFDTPAVLQKYNSVTPIGLIQFNSHFENEIVDVIRQWPCLNINNLN